MTELKMTIGHIISVQRMSSWVHWRSIPSRRLWQSEVDKDRSPMGPM